MRPIAIAVVTVCFVAGCTSDGTATSSDDDPPIVLEADGLGVVSFGDTVEEALPKLIEALGEPSVDQTLTPPWPAPSSSWKSTPDQPCTQATGYKCVDYLRRVAWEESGLAVVFSDVRAYSMSGAPNLADPHLVVWEHWVPTTAAGFFLPSGIGPGSTVGDLRAHHETDVGDMAFGCPGGEVATTGLHLPEGEVYVLPGNELASSTPLDGSTEITFMWAGFHKECRFPLPFDGPRGGEIVTSASAPAACGWLGTASIDLALHEERIQVSPAESDAHPSDDIVAQLATVCPDLGEETIAHLCEQYRIATDPDEVAYRESIHGSYYADKQTSYHWQNASWTAAWVLAVRGEAFDEASVERLLTGTCGPAPASGQPQANAPTTTATTTTTAQDETAEVGFSVAGLPNGRLVALPGSGGALGSGCTPNSLTLPDGIWVGWITERGPAHADFDLACVEAMPERLISNQSGRLRTVDVSEGAVAYPVDEDGWTVEIPYRSWWHTPQSEFCSELVIASPDLPAGCPSVLFINQGLVTEILEIQIW